jgi:hypothetical protein
MLLQSVDRLGALVGGGLIALTAAMPALEAQAPAPRQTLRAAAAPNDGRITVTGCLLLGPYGDYTLSKTIVATGSIMQSVAWKLSGGKELLGHVLEKVEVTGTMRPTPPGTLGAIGFAGSDRPAGGDQAASYRLHVEIIRKIAGDCS